MAVLNLGKVWINLLDTGVALNAYSADRGQTINRPGEVTTFAGGRERSISQVGRKFQFAVKLRKITRAQLATLDDWAGQLVQVRDHRGLKVFGVYRELSITEWTNPLYVDVSLQVQEVTFNEVV